MLNGIIGENVFLQKRSTKRTLIETSQIYNEQLDLESIGVRLCCQPTININRLIRINRLININRLENN